MIVRLCGANFCYNGGREEKKSDGGGTFSGEQVSNNSYQDLKRTQDAAMYKDKREEERRWLDS